MKKLLVVMMLLSPSVYAKDSNLSKISANGHSEYINADMALYIISGSGPWGDHYLPDTKIELDLKNLNKINLKVSGSHKIELQCESINYTEGQETALISDHIAVSPEDTRKQGTGLSLSAICHDTKVQNEFTTVNIKFDTIDNFFSVILLKIPEENQKPVKSLLIYGDEKHFSIQK